MPNKLAENENPVTSIDRVFVLAGFLAWSSGWPCLANEAITIPPATAGSSPPQCDCCVMKEAPSLLSHRLRIAPEEATLQRISLSGVVYESDGRSPARNVMMYFYHTDATGHYSKRGDEDRRSFAWWHGTHRGWLKTNDRGEYHLDTIKPAPYPDGSEPAHVHTIIKAPTQKHCYYIADFVFQDDPLLSARYWENTARWWRSLGLAQTANYGGVKLFKNRSGQWEGRRDITLFREYDLPAPNSGREILDESPAFDPQHAWGPDKGSHACPMCKYGYRTGVLYWVNSDTNWKEVESWAHWLEALSLRMDEEKFKAYLIYSNPQRAPKAQLEARLSAFGQQLNLRQIAVTYVPAVDDTASSAHLNRINPQTRNTFIVYSNRKVADKFVNHAFTDQNTKLLEAALTRASKEKELYLAKEASKN